MLKKVATSVVVLWALYTAVSLSALVLWGPAGLVISSFVFAILSPPMLAFAGYKFVNKTVDNVADAVIRTRRPNTAPIPNMRKMHGKSYEPVQEPKRVYVQDVVVPTNYREVIRRYGV